MQIYNISYKVNAKCLIAYQITHKTLWNAIQSLSGHPYVKNCYYIC